MIPHPPCSHKQAVNQRMALANHGPMDAGLRIMRTQARVQANPIFHMLMWLVVFMVGSNMAGSHFSDLVALMTIFQQVNTALPLLPRFTNQRYFNGCLYALSEVMLLAQVCVFMFVALLGSGVVNCAS